MPVAAASNVTLVFSLTVNHESHTETIRNLSESHYEFTAPNDSSCCVIYNFSVTATYFGATYAGAGCPFIGTSLNNMLPSLPDTKQLDASLQYTLVKQLGGLNLNVSFEVYI